jgi:hypothetical protein
MIFLDAATAQAVNDLLKLTPFGEMRRVVQGESISLGELIDWITVAIKMKS